MPDQHVINTRIRSKYDTIKNWIDSSSLNPPFVPLRGEICVVEIPSTVERSTTGQNNQAQMTPPAIAIKVGDGEHTFIELPWIQGIAGDVYAWAKTPEKPTYNINEIEGIEEYATDDFDTEYRIIQGANENINKYYLQKRTINKKTSSETEEPAWMYVDFEDNSQQEPLAFLNLNNLTADMITSGIFPVERGGTGLSEVPEGHVLIGSGENSPSLNTIAIDTTVTENSENLITSNAVNRAINNIKSELTGAMHFKGVLNSLPDATTTNTYDDYDSGDVILVGAKEYVYNKDLNDINNSKWVELGDEGSYALKTIEINSGEGLTGGGSLAANQTIAHAVPDNATSGNKGGATNSRTYIQQITTDKFGHVTGVATASETVTDTTYTFAEGTENGNFSVTPLGGAAQSVPIHGLAAAAYKDVDTTVTSNSTNVPTSDAVATAISNAINGVSIYGLKEGSNDSNSPSDSKYLIFDCGTASILIDNENS